MPLNAVIEQVAFVCNISYCSVYLRIFAVSLEQMKEAGFGSALNESYYSKSDGPDTDGRQRGKNILYRDI